MKLVIIESPYAGNVEENVAYAKKCLLDSLRRGEAPFASHLLYTQVLDDLLPEERTLGMLAGFQWGEKADLCAVYTDNGISNGMMKGVAEAARNKIPVECRTL